MVKRLPAMRETWVQSLGWEDLLEKEMATHSSILAWKISWMAESGRLQSMGSQRLGHDWATLLSLFTFVTLNITLISRCLYVYIIFKQLDWNLLYGCLLRLWTFFFSSVQFSLSVVSASSWPNEPQHARPPIHHQLPQSTQTHVHWVCDAIQPSYPLSSPSAPAFNHSQHQGLFKWVSS